jgi:hypothetical protein
MMNYGNKKQVDIVVTESIPVAISANALIQFPTFSHTHTTSHVLANCNYKVHVISTAGN